MFLLHGFIAVNRDEIISREVTVSHVMHDYGEAMCVSGARKRMTVPSMRAIFPARDASLPLICLGTPFAPWR